MRRGFHTSRLEPSVPGELMAERPLPAYDGDEPYVFVSYSHEDDDLVYPEIRWLQDQGFNVWYDEGISGATRWRDAIAGRLSGCHLLLFYVSPASVESQVCREELEFALDGERPVLSVHVEPTTLPDGIRLAIANRQALLRHELERDDYERKLLSAVATYLEQPLPEISLRAPSRKSTPQVSLALAVVGALLVGGFVAIATWFTMRSEPSTPQPLAQFPIDLPENVAIPTNALLPHPLDISSDGTRIVFHGLGDDGVSRLYVRSLNEPMATPIKGAEGNLGSLYLSPDGEWVVFHDRSDDALKKVRVSGGSPVTIAKTGTESSPIHGLSWGADGTIVFGTDAYPGLMRVSDTGGTPERLTEPLEGELHAFPHLLPDGSAVLFSVFRVDRVGEFAQVAVRSLVTGKQQILVEGSLPHVTSSGHLLFLREGTIWAMAFDADRLRVSGKAVPVLEDVYTFAGVFALFSVAADGSIVYLPSSSADSHHLVWMDLDGRETAVAAPARNYAFARISPDGGRVAVGVFDEDGLALWIYSVDRGTMTRLTSADAVVTYAIWSPDGQELAYSSESEGVFNLYTRSADGTGVARHLAINKRNKYATSWSADGQEVLYFECDTGEVACDLGRLTMVGEPSQELFLATEFDEGFPALSPNGRWVAYQSNASGRSGIYVRSYPDMDGRVQISINHGVFPRWSRNGRTLYYIESRRSASGRVRQMMSVAIEETEDGIEAGVAQAVFDVGPYNAGIGYALHPDGEHFLLAKLRDSGVHRPILVQNWLEEVKRLVPTD